MKKNFEFLKWTKTPENYQMLSDETPNVRLKIDVLDPQHEAQKIQAQQNGEPKPDEDEDLLIELEKFFFKNPTLPY